MWNQALTAQMARVTVAELLAVAQREGRSRQVKAAQQARRVRTAPTVATVQSAPTAAEPLCRPARDRAWA